MNYYRHFYGQNIIDGAGQSGAAVNNPNNISQSPGTNMPQHTNPPVGSSQTGAAGPTGGVNQNGGMDAVGGRNAAAGVNSTSGRNAAAETNPAAVETTISMTPSEITPHMGQWPETGIKPPSGGVPETGIKFSNPGITPPSAQLQIPLNGSSDDSPKIGFLPNTVQFQLQNCLNSLMVIRTRNGDIFWFYPAQLNFGSVTGYRWGGESGWYFSEISYSSIASAFCYMS